MLPMSLGCPFLVLFCLSSFCVLGVTNVTDVSSQNEDKQNKTKNGQPRDIGNISHTQYTERRQTKQN
jgi:hypothetical protein